MKLAEQKERILKRGLLKRGQTATEIASRLGLSLPQEINGALGALVVDGAAVRHHGRPARYSKV